MELKKLSNWFGNKHNPFEEISGEKIQRRKRRVVISEDVLVKYELFMKSHMTIKEISEHYGLNLKAVRVWTSSNKAKLQSMKHVGGIIYIHKNEIKYFECLREKNTTNCMNSTEIVNELNLNRSTVLEAIRNNRITGGFRYKNVYYAPREAVEQYKKIYGKIESIEGYYTVGEAAQILGYADTSIIGMIRSPKIMISGIKHDYKNTYYLLKTEVHKFKEFLDDIPTKYYTIKQIVHDYKISTSRVKHYFNDYLSEEIKWVLLVQQYERIVPRDEFNTFYSKLDKYRIEKLEDPYSIFTSGISHTVVPVYLKETITIYLDFVKLKQNTSRASKEIQRMVSREYVFLYKMLIKLEKELFSFSDIEIKWLLRTTKHTNVKKNLVRFLIFLQREMQTEYQEEYRIVENTTRNQTNNIYSLEEFTLIERHLKDIELHLENALEDRSYAVTWLYTSLHLTNAWRSSDFLRLPSIDISLIDVYSLEWFSSGNRLTINQAQHIVNQYAHRRLKVSKTGALNRFLINQDLLVPIATMIVICELHRQEKNDQFPLMTGKQNYALVKNTLSSFFPLPIKFGSMKMNRSFMTYLFHQATENSKSHAIALEMVQQTRGHKSKDSTGIYIKATNKDGPVENVTVDLCNRGHFGYLYNLLIEKSYSLVEREISDNLNERTLKIKEYRSIFPTPLELEYFGEFLRSHIEERESVAIRIARMSSEEAKYVLERIFIDQMPGHTEHAQCLAHPNCVRPTASSCIGCPNMIPKNYLLISVGIELKHRVSKLIKTNNIFIANREKNWIQKLLILLQEATNELGRDYTQSFINYEDLLADVTIAFKNKQTLEEL